MNQFHAKAPESYTEALCDRACKQLKASAPEYESAEVVLAIAHKNQGQELNRALASALQQTLVRTKIARVLVMDDQSESSWLSHQPLLKHPAVTLLSAECGSPARARNLLLDWADNQKAIKWIARLDADDELYAEDSLETLWLTATNTNALAAIGSNQLRQGEKLLSQENIAHADELLHPSRLSDFINSFAFGQQPRELPSCNLLLHTGLGLRYPNIRSAEDHWLLCRLLMLNQDRVAVCPTPIYSIYSLDGNDTRQNRTLTDWQDQRQRLAYVARRLSTLLDSNRQLLGLGMEGMVWQQHGQVIKEFYPWTISDSHVEQLKLLLMNNTLPLPTVRWRKCAELWQYHTPMIPHSSPGQYLPKARIIEYLSFLYRAGVSTLNIKRDNLLVTADGSLQYIDIGKDIHPLTTSNFRDMSARLYSIGILGNSDEELVRRHSWRNQVEALQALPGFEAFYTELIETLHPDCQPDDQASVPEPTYVNGQVTLLIKACSQDAAVLTDQVSHIITQLSYPVAFAKKILLIDSHPGQFLRQYAEPDLDSVVTQALRLKVSGLIDEILFSPTDKPSIAATYQRWFGQSGACITHTTSNAPLFPQIWSFDQIATRYVLQCDLDVLIGRRDWQHDFLADMLYASEPTDVLCVGFNIAKRDDQFNPYHGEPGQYAPEVRFGLLDLPRIRATLPMSNPLVDGKFSLTWHRALQAAMTHQGFRSLRGGDPNTFYVHPGNEHKHLPQLTLARDLIAQGREPPMQQEQFDWIPGEGWQYPKRSESLVFLLKGCGTEPALLIRSLNSLRRQNSQDFGLILIDDAGDVSRNWSYPLLLAELAPRTTLVRHSQHRGRMPNFMLAIKDLCTNPDALIAILDQDDCLMQTTIASDLLQAHQQGADLIQMPMFRPNKPLRLYQPDYRSPRKMAGANVWSHLRAFKKSLFEQVPEHYFQRTDSTEWFDTVTDYLTMLPMAELAESPVYLDTGYAYWHLRKDYGPSEKERERELILELLAMPALHKPDTDAAAPGPAFDVTC